MAALHRSLDKPDNLFFLSGKLEALDSPGEWWVNTSPYFPTWHARLDPVPSWTASSGLYLYDSGCTTCVSRYHLGFTYDIPYMRPKTKQIKGGSTPPTGRSQSGCLTAAILPTGCGSRPRYGNFGIVLLRPPPARSHQRCYYYRAIHFYYTILIISPFFRAGDQMTNFWTK